jgi:hypothetical protein
MTYVLRTMRTLRTLYLPTAAYVSPLTISYSDFYFLFAPSS